MHLTTLDGKIKISDYDKTYEVVADIDNLPLKDNSVKIIDCEGPSDEFFRVLKDGGTMRW